MIENIILIKNLHKSYGKIHVLKGIDLTIRKGSVFCLLGSNGAGKTTTVKILTTLIKPDSGEVKICGYDLIKQAKQVRKSISMTGQYAAVDELLTGRENMHMIGGLFHAENVKERTEELLERFELTQAADRLSSTYSGGMRRKLDIAMSLMGSPKILFLDEPTTGLDPQNRIAMWDEIRKLKKSGVTIFLTTQYLEEAEQLSDYVVILNDGVIAASGTVQELKGLLSSGAVELSFKSSEYRKASELLGDENAMMNEHSHKITVFTDGSVDALMLLLESLKKAQISVKAVNQKEPTLEEVFLTQIGIKESW